MTHCAGACEVVLGRFFQGWCNGSGLPVNIRLRIPVYIPVMKDNCHQIQLKQRSKPLNACYQVNTMQALVCRKALLTSGDAMVFSIEDVPTCPRLLMALQKDSA